MAKIVKHQVAILRKCITSLRQPCNPLPTVYWKGHSPPPLSAHAASVTQKWSRMVQDALHLVFDTHCSRM